MMLELHRYAADYASAKAALASTLNLSDDLLHVHMGLAIFVLAALLTRRRMRSWWPLGTVVAVGVVNEIIDFLGPDAWNDGLSALDLLNTLLWPTVLFLLARRSRGSSR